MEGDPRLTLDDNARWDSDGPTQSSVARRFSFCGEERREAAQQQRRLRWLQKAIREENVIRSPARSQGTSLDANFVTLICTCSDALFINCRVDHLVEDELILK